MAVKADVIKARIKALYPNLNLSSDRLNALSDNLRLKPADDATDETIDQIIKDFNDVLPFSEIAKQDDRLRNAEAKKPKGNEETAEEKAERLAREKADREAQEQAEKEMPEWFKTFQKGLNSQIESITTEVGNLKKGDQTRSKLQSAEALFNNDELLKAMPETLKSNWLKRVNLDEDLESQVTALSEEYKTLTGGNPPAGDDNPGKPAPAGAPPAGGKPKTQASAEEAKAMAKSLI